MKSTRNKLMYKLVGYHMASTNEAGWLPSCEHCGHDIKHCYIVQDETGQRLTVGSECVRSFLASEQQYSAEIMKKRANRAARQWRDANNGKKAPAIIDGETRADYINRRVAEMSNAYAAFTVYMRTCKRVTSAHQHCTRITRRFERRFGRACYKTGVEFYEPWRRMQARIGRQCNANPFDFTRSVWDVRKI